FRKTEVEHLGLSPAAYKNVPRLDVAMHNSLGMGRVQSVGNLNPQFQNSFDCKRLSHDHLLQSLSLEQFHCDESPPVELINFINCADVGMIEGRGRASLPAKALQCLRIARHIVRQKFERSEASEPYVLGFVNHAHSTATQFLDDAVVRGPPAD